MWAVDMVGPVEQGIDRASRIHASALAVTLPLTAALEFWIDRTQIARAAGVIVIRPLVRTRSNARAAGSKAAVRLRRTLATEDQNNGA
jgi:hypothetical protein